ncbi:MAG TPA: hypothetical protein IGS53_17500 [Leptolyngbyaceae cyanobacterium M33_DOE_097]|uniref:LSDAT prokaryote domain-containing protein n=1 Tax=Oscillatoriales cyanobacterium SpSt-418 TaxID=2282169 RepID=A0A7C3PJ57_9CYAN|nr:hypothetical protein [Leptolyngbyaceae cyanobacterium M33_DOE_097]
MPKPYIIEFFAEQSAIAIEVKTSADLKAISHTLQVTGSRPVIVLVGGAGELRHYHVARLHTLFLKAIVAVAEEVGAIVIDGGTDTGVMQMMGRAYQKASASFPLIGVLPAEMAILPTNQPSSTEAAALEPNHTHFVLTPGQQWGDESAWMADLANVLASGKPSVTVLINGGAVTWKDAAESVRVDRPIIAIADTGRAADAIAHTLTGASNDAQATQLIASGLVEAIELEQVETLRTRLQDLLTSKALFR